MKKKILLVEDDLLACRAYQKRLINEGYDVDCAIDGEDGFAKSYNGYDCIILDIMLPKLDGWQVLERVKGDDRIKNTPIIVFTVLDGDHHRKNAAELGAHGFVNKHKDDLISTIKKILSS